MHRKLIRFVYVLIIFGLALGLAPFAAARGSLFKGSIRTGTSLNWAGYIMGNGKVTSVSGSWVVSNVRANRNMKADATWIGIGGVNSADLIQTGTQAITGNLGKVIYQAWYELLPNYSQPVPLEINSGDVINANILMLSKNKWKIILANQNTGKTFEKTVSYKSSLSSAEWIEEAPSLANTIVSLDNFKSVKFTSAYVVKDGKRVNLKDALGQAVAMVNSRGKIIALPSAIDSKDDSFVVNRVN